jgi:peptidoglycan hydrolase-like protein with peptidoglycan-binding domain
MAETITASVGTSPAPNRFQDVETIQSLLNQVPPNQGGPQPLLDLDGICGPLTTGAIRRFQQFQFNFQDGRVDPNQRTLAKLNEFDLDLERALLHERDLPVDMLVHGSAIRRSSAGAKTITGSSVMGARPTRESLSR